MSCIVICGLSSSGRSDGGKSSSGSSPSLEPSSTIVPLPDTGESINSVCPINSNCSDFSYISSSTVGTYTFKERSPTGTVYVPSLF